MAGELETAKPGVRFRCTRMGEAFAMLPPTLRANWCNIGGASDSRCSALRRGDDSHRLSRAPSTERGTGDPKLGSRVQTETRGAGGQPNGRPVTSFTEPVS